MRTLEQHRKLENNLRNTYGYQGIKTVVDKLTGEATIIMTTAEDSKEMYEVFGSAGYSFGFETKQK